MVYNLGDLLLFQARVTNLKAIPNPFEIVGLMLASYVKTLLLFSLYFSIVGFERNDGKNSS